jgi:hypothetical protein
VQEPPTCASGMTRHRRWDEDSPPPKLVAKLFYPYGDALRLDAIIDEEIAASEAIPAYSGYDDFTVPLYASCVPDEAERVEADDLCRRYAREHGGTVRSLSGARQLMYGFGGIDGLDFLNSCSENPVRCFHFIQGLVYAVNGLTRMQSDDAYKYKIHGDLKPENMVVDYDKVDGVQVAHVRLIDWGRGDAILAAFVNDRINLMELWGAAYMPGDAIAAYCASRDVHSVNSTASLFHSDQVQLIIRRRYSEFLNTMLMDGAPREAIEKEFRHRIKRISTMYDRYRHAFRSLYIPGISQEQFYRECAKSFATDCKIDVFGLGIVLLQWMYTTTNVLLDWPTKTDDFYVTLRAVQRIVIVYMQKMLAADCDARPALTDLRPMFEAVGDKMKKKE